MEWRPWSGAGGDGWVGERAQASGDTLRSPGEKRVFSRCERHIAILSDSLEELPETDEPVWILGKQYDVQAEKSKLLSDISARLWFTYRRKFSPIDWCWEKHQEQPEEYHRILKCFLDRKDCCYSIHQMAQMGVGEGKSIGEWFGPNTVAQVLKKLALFDEWNSLAVYVSMDNTVVIEDIKKMCHMCPPNLTHDSLSSSWNGLGWNTSCPGHTSGWRPLLLIVPLRLGINQINPVYVDAFKECFKMPQSLGALGGKPNSAYYFIGFLGDELIYLDPHTTQTFVDSEENGTVDDQSFHCQQSPHRMKILNLDPSVALGFFCKEEEDFDNWCGLVQKEILKPQSLQMFELVQKHPAHWPPFIPPTKPEVTTTGAELIESTNNLFELEEDFEILSM
ncbi:cysteine protease ATG4A isoform X2 [Phascolarctos cinereus]